MYISDNIPGRKVITDGRDYLFFSGTSYLGMNCNAAFRECVLEGMDKYGTNYSSSRNSNFRLSVYEEAEQHIADYTGAEAALTVSSGYMAGQLAVRSFEGKGEFIFAPNVHPALWTSPTDFFYADFKKWVNDLPVIINDKNKSPLIVVTNSLDPLLAVNYDFDWVSSLPEEKNIVLIIDDSHGFGITGKNGSGIFNQVNKPDNVTLVVVSSFGKAMGIPGGIILSDGKTIEALKKSTYFNTSSPVIPAYLFAYLKSDQLYQQSRTALAENIKRFISLTGGMQLFNHFKNYPVFYTSHNMLYPFLEKNNILISSFAYPLPEDDLVTRVVINSNHTQDDIQQLAECIAVYARQQ